MFEKARLNDEVDSVGVGKGERMRCGRRRSKRETSERIPVAKSNLASIAWTLPTDDRCRTQQKGRQDSRYCIAVGSRLMPWMGFGIMGVRVASNEEAASEAILRGDQRREGRKRCSSRASYKHDGRKRSGRAGMSMREGSGRNWWGCENSP